MDPVLFSESGDNKIEEQCIKFVFEILYNTTMSRFIEQRLYTLDEVRAELASTSVV